MNHLHFLSLHIVICKDSLSPTSLNVIVTTSASCYYEFAYDVESAIFSVNLKGKSMYQLTVKFSYIGTKYKEWYDMQLSRHVFT